MTITKIEWKDEKENIIELIKEDYEKFGEDEECILIYKLENNKPFLSQYSLDDVPYQMIRESLEEGEHVHRTTLGKAIKKLNLK